MSKKLVADAALTIDILKTLLPVVHIAEILILQIGKNSSEIFFNHLKLSQFIISVFYRSAIWPLYVYFYQHFYNRDVT